jgi:hypothetical protein
LKPLVLGIGKYKHATHWVGVCIMIFYVPTLLPSERNIRLWRCEAMREAASEHC